MRLVFFGTPAFAVASLEALIAVGHEVAAVVTQPVRPRGRGLKASPSPVALAATAHGLKVLEPVTLRGFAATLRDLAPELLVVVAYGRILPREVLEAAPRGALNVHASLLPRWRGAAPIARAILAGDAVTGIAIMQLDQGLDTGPVYAMREEPIAPDDTAATLSDRLAQQGAHLLVATLAGIAAGELEAVAQDHAQATVAPKLESEEGRLDFDHDAASLARRVRALNPRPGAYTLLHGKRLKVHRARAVVGSAQRATPGVVLSTSAEGFTVSCGEGSLEVLEAQLEGKPARPARDLVNGRQVKVGDGLGD